MTAKTKRAVAHGTALATRHIALSHTAHFHPPPTPSPTHGHTHYSVHMYLMLCHRFACIGELCACWRREEVADAQTQVVRPRLARVQLVQPIEDGVKVTAHIGHNEQLLGRLRHGAVE